LRSHDVSERVSGEAYIFLTSARHEDALRADRRQPKPKGTPGACLSHVVNART
jgi:hypothetical protein